MEVHASQIILHMLHLTTKPYSSPNEETIHVRAHPLAAIEALLPCDLAHMHCDVRQGVGAQVMRVVNYAHFALTSLRV